jgi:hypothetical protein
METFKTFLSFIPDKILWLNANIMVYDFSFDFLVLYIHCRITQRLRRHIQFKFDQNDFKVGYLTEPTKDDLPFLDMLLESAVDKVATLGMTAHNHHFAEVFSSAALHQFLADNETLRRFMLGGFKIADDVCDVIARTPRNLTYLELEQCKLNVHLFATTLGANDSGPAALKLHDCRTINTTEYVNSFLVPLLESTRIKALELSDMLLCTTGRDFSLIKAALESNLCLDKSLMDFVFNSYRIYSCFSKALQPLVNCALFIL